MSCNKNKASIDTMYARTKEGTRIAQGKKERRKEMKKKGHMKRDIRLTYVFVYVVIFPTMYTLNSVISTCIISLTLQYPKTLENGCS